jgi:hypothetical protein
MFFDLAVGWVAKLYKTIRYQSNWPTSILRDCLQKKKKKLKCNSFKEFAGMAMVKLQGMVAVHPSFQ